MQITRSSIDTVKGPADWFTGDVYIDAVAAAPAPSRVSANLVHFMPGARTHRHRHPLGQTVFGLGGLGHMAVKLAHAMGADVTVLSQSLRKQDDGLKLGADAYYATSDDATFAELAGRFDLIVNTVSARIDIGRFLTLLRTDGALVNVGAPPEPLPVPAMPLIAQRRTFAGSAIGSIRETQEMLDFCAEHGIAAEIEVIAADQVNDAWERVLRSDVRYRFVIDNSTL